MHEGPIGDAVALFVGVLAAVTVAAVLVRRIHMPLATALVLTGLLVSVLHGLLAPGASPALAQPPDVILLVLLPGLVFEAAYRLDLPELRRVAALTVWLAGPGVVIGALVVAAMLSVAAGLPFGTALVLGAIVAATDPVAVVATMRDLHAPRRLTTLLDAESLFNDGTGIVLFGVVVAALTTPPELGQATLAFAVAVVASVAIGALVGFAAARLMAVLDDPSTELTLTVAVAYGSYLVADRIGQSGVIATVVAAIALRAFARPRSADDATVGLIDTVWESAAFVLSAVVFLLIGLSIEVDQLLAAGWPIAVGVAAVLLARGLVVYGLVGGGRHVWHLTARRRPGASARVQATLPRAWLHVLWWGGLRGAVAVALALALPEGMADRALLQAIAFGVVLFTLLVQGTSAGRLVARLPAEASPERGQYVAL